MRTALLVTTALIGLYVGTWSAAAPRGFYDSFPGLGFVWISIDGPYNEHLVRDTGALYLGLAVATAYGAVQRGRAAVAVARAVGLAWVVFSLPHLLYHLGHLTGLTLADVVMQVVSLSSTVVLGALIMVGDRSPADEDASQSRGVGGRRSRTIRRKEETP